MMKKIIVEVGSTVTKVDLYDKEILTNLKQETILFKKNYNANKCLLDSDVEALINLVNSFKDTSSDIYVCGTSIFRNLTDKELNEFKYYFKEKTNLDFNVISQEDENELTVMGATRNVKDKVCVFIGGGGSTELSIYDNKIIESVNSKFGVIDVMDKFPDLALDIATTPLEEVMDYIKDNLNLVSGSADTLILAGGAHEMFAREAKILYNDNTLYIDKAAPIMMDIDLRIKETKRFYEEISLDEIKSRVSDPNWWFATRAMCAFALVVADSIGAKYIIPTNINMAYGIINKK